MTDKELYDLMTAGIDYLKQTTAGYKGHPTSWYTNTTTNWYKGLTLINQALQDIVSRHAITISSKGTTKTGQTITFTITVS